MNWLAHSLLSTREIDYQLGNILADPFKARAWVGASKQVKDGMSMHKFIDAYTDSHSVVACSKSRLAKSGYLRGVVVDILYDHFLTKYWREYCNLSFEDYITEFNESSVNASYAFPTTVSDFVRKLTKSNRLAMYADLDGVWDTLFRVDQRLSLRIKRKETTKSYIPAIKGQYESLDSDFREYFPALVLFFKNHPLGSESNTYLR